MVKGEFVDTVWCLGLAVVWCPESDPGANFPATGIGQSRNTLRRAVYYSAASTGADVGGEQNFMYLAEPVVEDVWDNDLRDNIVANNGSRG